MRPDPIVLAFDTSAAHCAAALLIGDRIAATRVEDMSRGQAERLIPLLEEVLSEGGTTWQDLSAIGVGIGPGNFTGIRISVSAARGLALGLGIPAVGVSLFDTTQSLSNWAQTAVPAPRGQHYYFDPDKMRRPILTTFDDSTGTAMALSSEFPPAAHVEAMAHLASERAERHPPAPAPLYIKPPDAAPSRETGPVMLP